MTTQTLRHPQARPELPSFAGARLGGRGLLVLFLILALAGGLWLRGGGDAAGAPMEPAVFQARALGTVAHAQPLTDAPTGGAEIQPLAPGTAVEIGGKVELPAGLVARSVYWLRAQTEAGAVYGFLPASAVIVSQGDVVAIDPARVAPGSLLAPREGGAAAVPADAAVGAAMAGDTNAAASGSGADALDSPLGVSADGAAVALTGASIAIPWLPASVRAYAPQLEAAGQRHGVDPELLALVMLVESGGHPGAESPAGAIGLLQVMPGTGREIAQRRGIAGFSPEQLRAPAVAIDFGAWYLADMLRTFQRADGAGGMDAQRGVELAVAAYNGGPGHVGQHLTTGQPLHAETARYQAWLGGMWRERHQTNSPAFESWMAAGGARLVAAAEAEALAY